MREIMRERERDRVCERDHERGRDRERERDRVREMGRGRQPVPDPGFANPRLERQRASDPDYATLDSPW